MWVRGIDLSQIVLVEEGAEGIRISFRDGERKFVGGDEAQEILDAWHLERRLAEVENGE